MLEGEMRALIGKVDASLRKVVSWLIAFLVEPQASHLHTFRGEVGEYFKSKIALTDRKTDQSIL